MTQEYQTLTLTETHEEIIVGTTEYPLTAAGIFYIKFVQYEDTSKFGEAPKMKPVRFVTILPQNILKRETVWSQEEQDIIIFAAEEAREREATQREYQEAVEKEVRKRARETPPKPKATPEFKVNDEGEVLNIPLPDAPDKYDGMWG